MVDKRRVRVCSRVLVGDGLFDNRVLVPDGESVSDTLGERAV